MLEYTPHLIACLLYLVWGVATYRVFCKLVWISNDYSGPACDNSEKWSVRLYVILFWPAAILFMAD